MKWRESTYRPPDCFKIWTVKLQCSLYQLSVTIMLDFTFEILGISGEEFKMYVTIYEQGERRTIEMRHHKK